MNKLYEIDYECVYKWKIYPNISNEYSSGKRTIIANDVEEAKDKLFNNIWGYIDGCSSHSEIEIRSLNIREAKILYNCIDIT